MPGDEISRPIHVIFNGDNFAQWSQAMRSYLKSRKLWLYVFGDRPIPEQVDKETDSAYAIRIEDWESVNHQIITWFRNTSISSIVDEFGNIDIAKEVWDLLVTRYAGPSGAHNFKLTHELYQIRQKPGERITVYHSRLKSIWDQLIASEPVLSNSADTKLVYVHREQGRIFQFLMGLRDEFELARNHMTYSPNVVPSHTSSSLPTIYTANGSPMHISHLGNVSTPSLSVSNVYQIPKLTHNLLSVGQLTELGFSLTFSSTGVVVQDSQTGQIVGTARKVGRLFELIFLHLPSSRLSASAVSERSTSCLALWNSRLGHASISRVKQLVSRGLLGSVSNKSFDCMTCQFGKQTALPFNNSVSHALSSFDLIHSDVWGPSPISTPGGSRYFVIFVDDFS